jgi:uncharacterized DUF497 family protein
MKPLSFEWDAAKSKLNKKKHGVSFDEAQTVFYDDYARIFPDPDHSENEDRFILLGMSSRLRTLIVCHCYREQDVLIRIISARKATKMETGYYRQS